VSLLLPNVEVIPFGKSLEQLKAVQGEIEVGVSVVTIAELVHGAYRTKTQVQL
jgi:hypothetical protein